MCSNTANTMQTEIDFENRREIAAAKTFARFGNTAPPMCRECVAVQVARKGDTCRGCDAIVARREAENAEIHRSI